MALIQMKRLARSRDAPRPVEAEALEENVEANADAEPDPDEELGEIADETFGEEDRSFADLIAEAEDLERSDRWRPAHPRRSRAAGLRRPRRRRCIRRHPGQHQAG